MTRQAQCGAINHLCSGGVDILLEGSADTQKDERETLHPSIGIGLSFKCCFELSMESFDHAVSLRVVGSGARTFDSKE